MARRSTTLALLVVTALAAAPSAVAAPTTVARFVPSLGESSYLSPLFSYSGADLSGSSVVWARALPAGGWSIERAAPRAAVERVALSRRPRVEVHRVGLLGASATRVAWSDYAYDVISGHDMTSDTIRSQLRTLDIGAAAVSTLAGCGDGLPPCRCRPHCGHSERVRAELDGDVVAYVEGPTTSPTIVVDDLASAGDPVRIERNTIIDRVHIAGDHLAWFERDPAGRAVPRSVLYDWRNRRELRSWESVGVVALQADGKILAHASGGDVAWYGPGDAAPHTIDIPENRVLTDFVFAGDRLLLTYSGPVDRRGTTVADLDGRLTEIASGPGGPDPELYGAADFDGRRATWLARACGIVSVVLDTDVTRPGAGPPPSGCVPPAIADLSFAPAGRVRARVICEGGCRGRLSLYDLTSHPYRKLASRTLELSASPKARTVTFTPAARDRRVVAKRTRMRVQALFSGRDGGGDQVAAGRSGSLKRP